MAKVTSRSELANKLCKMVGEDPNYIINMTIRFGIEKPITLEVERYANDEGIITLESISKTIEECLSKAGI